MIVALTVWKDRISPVFDVSKEAMLIEILNKEVKRGERCEILASSLLGKIRWFVEKKVEVIICGAISESLFREFQFHRIAVNGFITGQVDDVIRAFLIGTLDEEQFIMPGCGHRRRQRRGRKCKKRRGEPHP